MADVPLTDPVRDRSRHAQITILMPALRALCEGAEIQAALFAIAAYLTELYDAHLADDEYSLDDFARDIGAWMRCAHAVRERARQDATLN